MFNLSAQRLRNLLAKAILIRCIWREIKLGNTCCLQNSVLRQQRYKFICILVLVTLTQRRTR